MRYTTLIDITDQPALYRNKNARLLYLHMVLKSGYHDNDRDLLAMSIRRLASDVGLTLSATRHALSQLMQAGLLKKAQGQWLVKKWIITEIPTPRTQKTVDKGGQSLAKLIKQDQVDYERYKQAVYNVVRSMTKEQLQEWLQELEEGKIRVHGGVKIYPSQSHIDWMKQVIKSL